MKERPLAMVSTANKSETEFYIKLQLRLDLNLIYFFFFPSSITRNGSKHGCHLKELQVEKSIALFVETVK